MSKRVRRWRIVAAVEADKLKALLGRRQAIAEEIGRPVDYREVRTDGARRAAEKLAELF